MKKKALPLAKDAEVLEAHLGRMLVAGAQVPLAERLTTYKSYIRANISDHNLANALTAVILSSHETGTLSTPSPQPFYKHPSIIVALITAAFTIGGILLSDYLKDDSPPAPGEVSAPPAEPERLSPTARPLPEPNAPQPPSRERAVGATGENKDSAR